MKYFRKQQQSSSVTPALTMVAIAVIGVSLTDIAIADSHIVRVDATSGVIYNSALSNYRSLDSSEQSSWKQSNDNVGAIGGWRTYANEAYQANKNSDEVEQENEAEANIQSVKKNSEPADSAVIMNPVLKNHPTMIVDDITNKTEENESMNAKNTMPKAIIGVSHQSATGMHRKYKEVTMQDWKAANDRVREIGGWRTYANEAYQANKRKAEISGANQ